MEWRSGRLLKGEEKYLNKVCEWGKEIIFRTEKKGNILCSFYYM
jgi:hypothetical protein